MKNVSGSFIEHSVVAAILNWLFGLISVVIAMINLSWGNDPGFGLFILLLSVIYFPQLCFLIRKKTGLGISGAFKIIVALFIIWASLGVGELFEKIELMMRSLS